MSDRGRAPPKEGSTEAPTRHALRWREAEFYDLDKVEREMERVFDICHGCRRCFNLCDSFPKLFDLVDNAPSGELDTVDKAAYATVADACTLCDMCFMTKCPYVPPHEFDLDFPHLILRYRAAMRAKEGVPLVRRELAKTDRNGRLAGLVEGLANWAIGEKNFGMRNMLEDLAGVHREAALPKYHGNTLEKRAKAAPGLANRAAPGYGRKAVLYATCFANFNNPEIGEAARAVLAWNGVEVTVAYPACCGMPMLEQGAIEQVAANARRIAESLLPLVEAGHAIVAPVPSCALMLKSEWPLILPDDPVVATVSKATMDITEYVVDIAKKEGLAPGLRPLATPVTLHLACHARAQNMGAKGAEMLRLIPDIKLAVIERCSGHGGAWGVLKENFPLALKVGRPVARQALGALGIVTSECPLAADHIRQGMERVAGEGPVPAAVPHPILLLAEAYGLGGPGGTRQ